MPPKGVVDPTSVLGTGLFSLSEAELNDQWLKEARHGEHNPESEEYGIRGFTFKARKPFHPERLADLLRRWKASAPRITGSDGGGGNENENSAPPSHPLIS